MIIYRAFKEAALFDGADHNHAVAVAMHMLKSMGYREFALFVNNYYDILLKDIDFLHPVSAKLSQIVCAKNMIQFCHALTKYLSCNFRN